ncbi:heterogeneous nuclear ribonucleoprotein U-like protein 1 isoform X3 [Colias croceus]|uniref:heterogeneous nuclear ribonucleoprotein U-like protein 1 isoform X3 n=1 Tax=Colias crocea TaxID=72248 RepID=UPI001E27E601|nr:heterogeneous nuclear ribonucleoprotein U-like protein 1 isoform X3 [Colias croceus]
MIKQPMEVDQKPEDNVEKEKEQEQEIEKEKEQEKVQEQEQEKEQEKEKDDVKDKDEEKPEKIEQDDDSEKDKENRDEEDRDEREQELTEEDEWDILNEKLLVKEQERIEREKRQAEEDAKLYEELSKNPIKLQRLKRKQEKKARWSNYYRTIEATNEILTPPPEPEAMLQRKESVDQKSTEPELNDNRVTLSWYDSDLNQYLELPELNSVIALSEGAFSHAWAGSRATHGVQDQRVCFEVRVGTVVTTNESTEKETVLNGLRIGWSTEDSSLHLGEGELSFGYESTGRAVHNGEFKEYGKEFQEKDVIGAYLDLQSSPCKIFYTLNGVELGTAFEFDKAQLGDRALFPHVLTKNMCYKVNMGYERYNLLTRTKIVRKRIEVPIEQILEEKRKREEEIKKRKEEMAKKRQERQKKRREDREKAEQERKEKEAEEDKKNDSMETDNDKVESVDKSEDGKDEDNKDEDNGKEDGLENGVKTEDNAEEAVEVKTEPAEADDSKADSENKEETGEVPEVTEDQVMLGAKLDKRVKFVIRHTVEEELDGPEACLVPGYVFISQADLVEGPRRPNSNAECEVILMVGMPGAGKTYWARKHCEENPDKRYNILSTGALFDKMKVDCKPFRATYEGRWDAMVSKCAKCVLKILETAKGRRRNFILDQTNVYPSAQRRKLREFEGFKRIAVVIVPPAEELAKRQASRETADGKEVPDPAVVDMKANFSLPEKGSWVDEVIYPELGEEEAKAIIEEYHKEARAAGVVREKEKRERSAARDAPPVKRPRSAERRRPRDDRRREHGRERDRWSSGGSRWGPGGMSGGGGAPRGGRWGPAPPRDRPAPQPGRFDRWPQGNRNDFGRDRDFRGRGPGGPGGPGGPMGPGMGPMGPGPRQDRGPRGPMDNRFGPNRDRPQNRPNQPDKRPPGAPGAMGAVGAGAAAAGSWQRGSAATRPNTKDGNNQVANPSQNQGASQNQNQNQQGWNQWAGGWGGWGNWGNQNQGWGNWNNWNNWNNQGQGGNSGGQQGQAGKGQAGQQGQGGGQQWPNNYTAQQWYQWQQWQQQQQGWQGYGSGAGGQQGTTPADQAQAWAQYYQNYGAGNAAGNAGSGAVEKK